MLFCGEVTGNLRREGWQRLLTALLHPGDALMGNHSGKESQVPMLPAAKQLHKELGFCMAIKRCGTAFILTAKEPCKDLLYSSLSYSF